MPCVQRACLGRTQLDSNGSIHHLYGTQLYWHQEGIEPRSEAWEAPIQPLNYARSLFLIVLLSAFLCSSSDRRHALIGRASTHCALFGHVAGKDRPLDPTTV